MCVCIKSVAEGAGDIQTDTWTVCGMLTRATTAIITHRFVGSLEVVWEYFGARSDLGIYHKRARREFHRFESIRLFLRCCFRKKSSA